MGVAYKDIPLREIDVTNELRDLTKTWTFLGEALSVRTISFVQLKQH